MSIIRLSAKDDVPYAPRERGDLVKTDYTRRSRTGKMAPLPDPVLINERSELWDYLENALASKAAALTDDQPLVVMVHGFLFDPSDTIDPDDPQDTDNPHGRIYHFLKRNLNMERRHHTTSWPLGLGFAEDDIDGRTGVAIAFGYNSSPGFASSLFLNGQNFYARAYDRAGVTAWVLVNVLYFLALRFGGEQRIDLLCHSLGSRVVIRALALAADRLCNPDITHKLPHGIATASIVLGAISRVIILGGAERVAEAQLMQRRLRELDLGNRRPVIYNMVSRENDVLDLLAENFVAQGPGNNSAVGRAGLGRAEKPDFWMDLQIDRGELREWMARQAPPFEIIGDDPDEVWDHWVYYTFPGNMAFYRSILRDRARWDLATLRAATGEPIPEGVPKDAP